MLTGRLFLIVGWFLGLVSLSVIALAGYWALDRQPPLRDIRTEFLRWEPERHVVWVVRTGMRDRACAGEIHRMLIGRAEAHLPSTHLPASEAQVLGPFRTEIPLEVPLWMTQVRLYRVSIDFACNPLQRLFPLTVALPDVPIPPPPGAPPHEQRPTLPYGG